MTEEFGLGPFGDVSGTDGALGDERVMVGAVDDVEVALCVRDERRAAVVVPCFACGACGCIYSPTPACIMMRGKERNKPCTSFWPVRVGFVPA